LTKTRALVELLVAGLFWGFGFVGTVWCLRALSPSAIVFYRFAIAFVTGMAFLLWKRKSKSLLLSEMGLSLVPGVFLWLTLFLQTWGLEHTTATNSTFITTLYVVLVPLLNSITGNEKLSWVHWLCVAIALAGTSLIVQVQNLTVLNWGDLMTFGCAIFAAIHIIVIGQRAMKTKDDFAFNTFQSFWMAAFSLVLFPFSSKWSLPALTNEGWIGMLALGFGSSLIAFFLQIRAQKVITPSTISLLFLLESPISCVFAFFLLNETLNGWQWIGAILILLACALISLKERQASLSQAVTASS
jgi:drug/metabolite transporter (DMT)-like permease